MTKFCILVFVPTILALITVFANIGVVVMLIDETYPERICTTGCKIDRWIALIISTFCQMLLAVAILCVTVHGSLIWYSR